MGPPPSGSGWTGDHLFPLIKDQDCLRVLALLATLIRNGELDDTCRSYLLGNPLYALPKPAGGVRPIVPAEPFYKMATATAIETNIDEVTNLLGSFQLGVGGKGGSEAAAWLLRALAQNHALLALDFANAFNSLDRAAMLRELFQCPELATMWRMVHWAYKEPTALWILDRDHGIIETILSGRGCRQGDPFAPILFAIAVKRIYEHMMGVGGAETRGVAILDDVTVAAPPPKICYVAPKTSSKAGATWAWTYGGQNANSSGRTYQKIRCRTRYVHGSKHSAYKSTSARRNYWARPSGLRRTRRSS